MQHGGSHLHGTSCPQRWDRRLRRGQLPIPEVLILHGALSSSCVDARALPDFIVELCGPGTLGEHILSLCVGRRVPFAIVSMIPLVGMRGNANIESVVRDPTWDSLNLHLHKSWHVEANRIKTSLIRLLCRILESLPHRPADLIILPHGRLSIAPILEFVIDRLIDGAQLILRLVSEAHLGQFIYGDLRHHEVVAWLSCEFIVHIIVVVEVRCIVISPTCRHVVHL